MIDRFWEGVRAGLPYAIAGGLLATSFGVLARDAGMPAWGAVLMSAVVFAGSAQIGALTIIGAGGGLGSALGAATLMNSRFLPIGIAFAPSLPGGPLQRAAQGQAVVDASLAIARADDGVGYDGELLFGSSLAQYSTWVGGTAVGAIAGSVIESRRSVAVSSAGHFSVNSRKREPHCGHCAPASLKPSLQPRS